VTLPEELVIPLERHLENRRTLFERDVRQGCGTVYLPYALARKYPNAPGEWGWRCRVPWEPCSGWPASAGGLCPNVAQFCRSGGTLGFRCQPNLRISESHLH
jgi:hypothetical protein